MPFQVDHTPIAALLALGQVAGAGAARQAKVARDMQLINQINQQNMQSQQATQQAVAADEANRISSALKYSELDQERAAADQARQERAATERARQQIDMEQFGQRQGLDVRQQDFAEQKFQQQQTENTAQKAAVQKMIDQIAPPGSPENQRLRLQYEANDRVSAPAPMSQSPARNINAILGYRETLVDKFGEPVPGREAELQQIDAQLRQMMGTMGGGTAPAQTGASVRVNTKAERDALPPGTPYVGPDGIPAIKR